MRRFGKRHLLVHIAGVDWLKTTFLTPDHKFYETVIQRSYVKAAAPRRL